MAVTLLVRRRLVYGDGDFAELVVWRVPAPGPPSDHGFKYRLVHIVDGVRVIGFDNERGKGDHRHDDGVETGYQFHDVDRLPADFVDAIENRRKAHGQD